MVTAGSWQHFEHGADIGLRAQASSRGVLFERMGEALTAVLTPPELVQTKDRLSIHCEAPDDALLLVDWLNALIYEMAVRSMLFASWHVNIDDHRLDAIVGGERVQPDRHHPAVEVKGATYTGLQVCVNADGVWCGQCIVDV